MISKKTYNNLINNSRILGTAHLKDIDLKDASFYYCFLKVEKLKIKGYYPFMRFDLEVPKWLVWYKKHIGLVNYARYVESRNVLKSIGKKKDHRFVGINARGNAGFKFDSLVTSII